MGNCEWEANNKSTITPHQFSAKDNQKLQNQPSNQTHSYLFFEKVQCKEKENRQELIHEMRLETVTNISVDQYLSKTTLDSEQKAKNSFEMGNNRSESIYVTRCQALSSKEIRLHLAQIKLQKK